MKTIFCSIIALLLSMSAVQAEEFFRLVSGESKKALHVENGILELGEIEPGWWSAMWERSSVGQGLFVFRNRYTGQYLVSSGDSVAISTETPSPTGVGPHYWRFAQPFRDAHISVLTNQSGRYLNGTPAGLSLASGASQSTLRLGEVMPPKQAEAPVVIVYQRILINGVPLHNQQGSPVFSPAEPGWWSAMWEVNEIGGGGRGLFMTFTNRWTGQMLSSSGTTLTTVPVTISKTGSEPFIWRAVRTGKNLEFLDLTNSQGASLNSVVLQQVENR